VGGVGVAAIGIASLQNLVTMGNGSFLEHLVLAAISVALVIFALAAFGIAKQHRQRDYEGLLR
jgi:hypothetical protein